MGAATAMTTKLKIPLITVDTNVKVAYASSPSTCKQMGFQVNLVQSEQVTIHTPNLRHVTAESVDDTTGLRTVKICHW